VFHFRRACSNRITIFATGIDNYAMLQEVDVAPARFLSQPADLGYSTSLVHYADTTYIGVKLEAAHDETLH
jgi:hypothetical protein